MSDSREVLEKLREEKIAALQQILLFYGSLLETLKSRKEVMEIYRLFRSTIEKVHQFEMGALQGVSSAPGQTCVSCGPDISSSLPEPPTSPDLPIPKAMKQYGLQRLDLITAQVMCRIREKSKLPTAQRLTSYQRLLSLAKPMIVCMLPVLDVHEEESEFTNCPELKKKLLFIDEKIQERKAALGLLISKWQALDLTNDDLVEKMVKEAKSHTCFKQLEIEI